MGNTYEIKVKVTEVTSQDGRKFNTFKAVQKDGRLVDLKFTKECKNVPPKSCTIVVPKDKINLDKNREYPCYWCKEILKIKESDKNKAVNLDDFFD